MALLLLDRSQLEVRSEGDALALYEAGVRRGTVPLRLVDRCVIQGSQTQLDSGVLMKLAEAGVVTIVMSPRQHRRTALILGPRHNDAAIRLAQSRRVGNDSFCLPWALSLVRTKLQRQRRALSHLREQRPDARKPLTDALRTVNDILARLPHRDSADAPPNAQSLRGHEGAAARAYFQGLASVMPPSLGFTGRNRRPPRDPVNACLSLGYAMAHTLAIQACNQAGLDPLLGFYHRPAFGRESLASDLIEPLRPAVDLWVWALLRLRVLREEHFSFDKGACLLGKAGRPHFFADWERSSGPWKRWLRLQTRSLARDLRDEGLPWLDPFSQDEDEDLC